jgi:zinc transporter, ZIP family
VPAWSFMLIPWAALLLGALAATLRTPSPALSSAIQHLAAGVVFAAAATEVLPDLQHQGSMAAILIGGGLGLAAMFGVKAVGSRLSGAWSLIALVGIDIFIDGVVLGIGFAAGGKQGSVLLAALTLEILFLGLTASEELQKATKSHLAVISTVAIGGSLLPLGALLGAPVHQLPPFYLAASFAFALIALLYLVTEELLVEAHHKPDSPLITSMFFVGFLGLLALETTVS